MLGALTSTFILALVLERAAKDETSAPVPAVVATETCGIVQGFIFFSVSPHGGSRKTVKFDMSLPPLAATTRTPLPVSMELPPPTATTPSHCPSLKALYASITCQSLGLEVILS